MIEARQVIQEYCPFFPEGTPVASMIGVVRAQIQVTVARELLFHEHDRRPLNRVLTGLTLSWIDNGGSVAGKEHQIHDIMSVTNTFGVDQ